MLPTKRQREERQAPRARKEGLVEEARRLHQSGVSLREIGRRLGLSRQTARKYVRVGVVPYTRRPRPSQLDPYKPYLLRRWGEGCRNAAQLLREIKAQGYPGSRSVLAPWVKSLRSSLPPPVRRRLPSARTVAWALTMPSPPRELEVAIEGIPALKKAREVSMAFLSMLREHSGDRLDEWLTSAEQTDIRELIDFAAGLRRDLEAVRAGLSLTWSQGQVEGHIHRLKLLKRQMYGRCSFETLRRRVLRVG